MKLPSGKEITLRRPTYGEIKEARAARRNGTIDDFYSALYPLLTGLSLDEISKLDGADGLALENAVDASLAPRKEEEEAPFENSSSPAS